MKKILQPLSSILTFIFVCCGLHFVMQSIGLSDTGREFRLHKVKTSEVETFEVPDEYGIPQQAFVQIASRQNNSSGEFEPIFVIKTNKGLYLPKTKKFHETSSFDRVGFDSKGRLRPAYVQEVKDGLVWTFDAKKAAAAKWDYSASFGNEIATEDGLMQNYVSSVNGQMVRFNKTYDYEQRLKRVRNWHPEVLSQDSSALWQTLKQALLDVFIL